MNKVSVKLVYSSNFTGMLRFLGHLARTSPKVMSNSTRYPVDGTRSMVTAIENDRYVVLKSIDKSFTYPTIWLRDNCQCSECYNRSAQSRAINWIKFDINYKPIDVQFNNESNQLNITWNDNHKSEHKFDWLKNRSFDPSDQLNYLNTVYRPIKSLWSREQLGDFQKFDFNSILTDDSQLLNWLECLAINGVALIENAGHDITKNSTSCRSLCDRIAFIRQTHYGKEYHVQAKSNPNNLAYTSTLLQMHTDLPYYEYKPGVNLLHCVVQSEGHGAKNLISDGFYVAKRLKEEKPDLYQLLTTVLVNWNDIGVDSGHEFHSIYRAPVICLDREGRAERINHNIGHRDSYFSIDVCLVNDWYVALKEFIKMGYAEAIEFKTKPGDIFTFDNIRILHGRTEYQDSQSNSRHLIGAYQDWDEIYSRLRVLKFKQTTSPT